MTRLNWLVGLSVILVFQVTMTHSAPSGSIPILLEDRFYPFAQQLAARGIISLEYITQTPLSRAQAAEIIKSAVNHYHHLTDQALRDDLDYYIREFSVEINQMGEDSSSTKRTVRPTKYNPSEALKKTQRYLVAHREPGWEFTLNPLIYGRVDEGGDKTILRRGTGIQFWGKWREGVGFFFRFVDHIERGGGPYWERDQLLETNAGYIGPLRGGSEISWDITEAVISSNIAGVDLALGRQDLRWGSGDEPLALSGNGPPFVHFQMRLPLGRRGGFSYILGAPTAFDAPGDTAYRTGDGWLRVLPAQKWISLHRVEYSPTGWLRLAVGEGVVWGERGLQPGYLLPISFLYSAEHDGLDRDNVMLFGDATVRLVNRGLLWADLLIDDLSVSQIGGANPGNKVGFQVGGALIETGVDGITFSASYTRLEPYVYSHFFPVNRWSNWGASLGSSLAPNSDRWCGEISWRPRRFLAFNVRVERFRHGSAGGEIVEGLPPNYSGDVRFLDGERTNWTKRVFSFEIRPWAGVVISGGKLTGDRLSPMPDRYFLSAAYRIER